MAAGIIPQAAKPSRFSDNPATLRGAAVPAYTNAEPTLKHIKKLAQLYTKPPTPTIRLCIAHSNIMNIT
jgi:hypothetical protein